MSATMTDCPADETRLFYVTDSVESNEEIFETYQKAIMHYWKMSDDNQELVRLRICEVNHAYFDKQLNCWNYDDKVDTFTDIYEYEVDNDYRDHNEDVYGSEEMQERADAIRDEMRDNGESL